MDNATQIRLALTTAMVQAAPNLALRRPNAIEKAVSNLEDFVLRSAEGQEAPAKRGRPKAKAVRDNAENTSND